jgi:hypothetical protein
MASEQVSGVNDFDFLIGRWEVLHRQLKLRLAGDSEWTEFFGTAKAQKILAGFGNLDEFQIALPSGPYIGSTLRLYSPSMRRWSIYWMDSRNPKLDPPMVGHFYDGRGLFFGKDTFDGKPIDVRFIWSDMTSSSCRWEQAFSADGGKIWETNWVMRFSRVD